MSEKTKANKTVSFNEQLGFFCFLVFLNIIIKGFKSTGRFVIMTAAAADYVKWHV